MAHKPLTDTRVAVLVTHGFEQVEMTDPRQALLEAGAQVDLVSPERREVKGWNHGVWGETFPVDVPLAEADPGVYDALLLPGGVMNPDKLRMNSDAVAFVRTFFIEDKPVAAICHGPWTLIDAGVVGGRRMTSYPSIRRDLENAGAFWSDDPVVVDKGLVTSRRPADLPVFAEAMLEAFAQGALTRRAMNSLGA